jgi:hypothetical protein
MATYYCIDKKYADGVTRGKGAEVLLSVSVEWKVALLQYSDFNARLFWA